MNKQWVLASALAAMFSAGSANALPIHDSSGELEGIDIAGHVNSPGKFHPGPLSRISDHVLSYAEDDVNAAVKVTVVSGKRDPDEGERGETKVILTWYALDVGLGDLDRHSGRSTGIYMALPKAMEHARHLTFVFADHDAPAPASLGLALYPLARSADSLPEFGDIASMTGLPSADFLRMPLDATMPGVDASLEPIGILDVAPGIIPEPAVMSLLGMGLLGLGFMRRKRGAGIA